MLTLVPTLVPRRELRYRYRFANALSADHLCLLNLFTATRSQGEAFGKNYLG